jgi:hypothetical protein
MFFVIFFCSFNTDDKCPNQTQILPNNGAHCEVRWKRDGLLSDAGQELNEQSEYRDLLHTFVLLALQIYHVVTDLSK